MKVFSIFRRRSATTALAAPAILLASAATGTFTTAAGSKTVPFTVAANALPIAFVAHTGSTDTSVPTDDVGDSGVWVLIATATKTTGADFLGLYVRSKKIAAAGTYNITQTGASSTGGGISVLQASNMVNLGAAAIKQFKVVNAATSSRPSATFDAVPDPLMPVVGADFSATNPAALTARAGYAELVDTGYATPSSGIHIMSIDAGETSATIQWGTGNTGSAHCTIIFELDQA